MNKKDKFKMRIIYKNGLYHAQWRGLFCWRYFWVLQKHYPYMQRKAIFSSYKEAEKVIFDITKHIKKERNGKIVKEFEV
jgi:hypothetical protein